MVLKSIRMELLHSELRREKRPRKSIFAPRRVAAKKAAAKVNEC